jgi:hypothetical protein
MARKTTHVVPNENGGWSVKKGGAQRASKRFDTKKEAVDYGRKLSKESHSEFIIHRKDGTIQNADSHGGDPCPPRDKK